MLWGVYTDHKNLVRDALGITSDWEYRWRLLLEEYGPKIVYIKGIHNTIADVNSWLEAWVWPQYQLNSKFKKLSKAELDDSLKTLMQPKHGWHHRTWRSHESCASNKDISFKIFLDTQVFLCKNDKLIIPTSLQHRAVSWYHHYLQHPGHSWLEEMMRFVM